MSGFINQLILYHHNRDHFFLHFFLLHRLLHFFALVLGLLAVLVLLADAIDRTIFYGFGLPIFYYTNVFPPLVASYHLGATLAEIFLANFFASLIFPNPFWTPSL